MKAVILETKNGKAAVMVKGGEMRYIDDKGYESGQIVEIPDAELHTVSPVIRFKASRKVIAAAASVVILLSAGGITAYATPVSTVSLDTYPAIRYKVNMFDRVVGFSANDSSEETTEDSSYISVRKMVRGKKIDEAIDITFNELGDNISANSDTDTESVTVNSVLPGRGENIRERVQVQFNDHFRNESLPNVPGQNNKSEQSPASPDEKAAPHPGSDIKNNESDVTDIPDAADIPEAADTPKLPARANDQSREPDTTSIPDRPENAPYDQDVPPAAEEAPPRNTLPDAEEAPSRDDLPVMDEVPPRDALPAMEKAPL